MYYYSSSHQQTNDKYSSAQYKYLFWKESFVIFGLMSTTSSFKMLNKICSKTPRAELTLANGITVFVQRGKRCKQIERERESESWTILCTTFQRIFCLLRITAALLGLEAEFPLWNMRLSAMLKIHTVDKEHWRKTKFTNPFPACPKSLSLPLNKE